MRDRLPAWFKKKAGDPKVLAEMRSLFDELSLHTICENALCPNLGDCFSQRTATFLILGDICTRNCTFCAVKKGVPSPVDEEEPQHLTEAAGELGLRYVVITSVTRDDLPDGGASHFAKTIARLREKDKGIAVEVLIPDFGGSPHSLKMVADAHPDVINHNLETVPRLYPEVRPKADFQRSLMLLEQVKRFDSHIVTKSGVMVGLGETKEELLQVMEELRMVNCDLLTIGQYLQPSEQHHPIVRFVPPEEFLEYERIGKEMGFSDVASAPLVRSSFNAAQLYTKTKMESK
ncbi:MAG: lipoyl synthase [Dehalococcoidia bacterium]|nr:MAG: lipoyl synthase [Dehalococcoidia bacterium]